MAKRRLCRQAALFVTPTAVILPPWVERTRVLEPNTETIDWPSSLSDEDRLRLVGRFGAEVGEIVAQRAEWRRHVRVWPDTGLVLRPGLDP